MLTSTQPRDVAAHSRTGPLGRLVRLGWAAGLAVALVLAIALGTPGCEIGVWPELIARVRGGRASASAGLACIVGVHLVDAWEARHRTST
jgi:hypothetical protein